MRMVLSTLLTAALAAPVAAQEAKPRQPAPHTATRVWINGEDVTGRFLPLMQRRARLGVVVALEAKETDALGAFIQSVTPGGPAAKAGLRSGDIITKLDGQALLAATGRKVGEDESVPGVRLIELAAKLEPNDTVSLEYLRGDARRTTTLVTGDEPVRLVERDNAWAFRFGDGDRLLRTPGMRLEGVLPERMEVFRDTPGVGAFASVIGPFGDLELAPINADLGWYFGTTEGVLVVRAPAGSSLGLKAGDVVLSVDGRKPTNPGNLIRILRSYEAGDSIRLEIMRQKQRQTVTGNVERRDGF
jgi:predicted metalloprotease with PDZ domain